MLTAQLNAKALKILCFCFTAKAKPVAIDANAGVSLILQERVNIDSAHIPTMSGLCIQFPNQPKHNYLFPVPLDLWVG